MSKLSKAVAVVAVVGSAAWVGHQVVRHHEKVGALRAQFHALAAEHELGHEHAWREHHVREFDEKDSGGHETRHGDDDHDGEEWGSRHSHDGGHRHHFEHHHHRRGDDERDGGDHHRRHHDDKEKEDQRERRVYEHPRHPVFPPPEESSAPQLRSQPPPEIEDVNVPVTEVAVEAPVNFVDLSVAEDAPEVPELEDNEDQDTAPDGQHRHHARRHRGDGEHRERRHKGEEHEHWERRDHDESREVHFRDFEHENEQSEEFRRLAREARRLHHQAHRTVGGFVAGAAFVGGIAHLHRARRDRKRRHAEAAAVPQNFPAVPAQYSTAVPVQQATETSEC